MTTYLLIAVPILVEGHATGFVNHAVIERNGDEETVLKVCSQRHQFPIPASECEEAADWVLVRPSA